MKAALPGGERSMPQLQQELRLVGNTTDLAGNRLWTVYDPVRHRYSALSQKDYAMLAVWEDCASADEILDACWRRHAEIVTHDDVADLAMFLVANGLAIDPAMNSWRTAFAGDEKRRSAYLNRLLHSYLFFRVPLARPERFLRATLPLVRGLGSRTTVGVVLIAALAGLFLVSREFDEFALQLSHMATLNGAAGFVLAVACVKILHELGHGYVAVHHGCRVPTLGIAFILGAPLLYVDVTDAWKLQSRRARMAIDSAGIAVDLTVSVIATLAWVFLPMGGVRDAAFTLATAGWITSLAFNLNPFMKFDGYHLLVDLAGLPNLQSRAMGLARWRIRELMFGIGDPPPEQTSRPLRRILVAFGWSVWLYRVVLFTAIALAVYHYFFKLLGIILFAVEIGYFIVLPIWHEFGEWISRRREILASRRTWVTLFACGAASALLVVPWSTTVIVPAVLEPAEVARLHVPVPARIVSLDVSRGAHVEKGASLASLSSVALEHEMRLAQLKAAVLDLRLARQTSDTTDREMATILQRERWSLEETMSGLQQRMNELKVVSPRTGHLTTLVEHAAPGRWVPPSEPIAIVHSDSGARVRGLVAAADVSRVRPGMSAVFIPNDLFQRSRQATVMEVAAAPSTSIDQLELAASHGGTIPSRLTSNRAAAPLSSQYAVIARLPGDHLGPEALVPPQPQVGVLRVSGDAQGLLQRIWNRILLVLVRESGF